ncbi:hypothetical protein SLA2020_142160 [Shorea laevis]
MNKSVSDNPMELSPESLSHLDLEDDEDSINEFVSVKEEVFEDNVDAEDLMGGTKVGSAKEKDWRRVRKTYARSKHYIFVTATLPLNGTKTAGAVLKKMFPDAIWVRGNYLHQHNPRLEEKWIEVTVDSQVNALIDAVRQFRSKGSDYEAGISWTMVFAKTVEAVEAVAKILGRTGIKYYRYHKDLCLQECSKTLVHFQEEGGILVCTDAAARGVDVPNVSHVVQEAAFSRKRSFWNKLKKRGSSKVGDTLAVELTEV